MSPLSPLLRTRIASEGPIRFSEFMEAALYHPEHGYYTRRDAPRDPFGKEGDFFTASQLQPVFGRLVHALLSAHRAQLGDAEGYRAVEWGAGRGEMAPYLADLGYCAVEALSPPPEPFRGAIFSNELFDALPVDVARVEEGAAHMMRVAASGDSFVWQAGEELDGEWREYALTLAARFEHVPSVLIELPIGIRPMLERMASSMAEGAIIAIDYGYTEREIIRFPQGTLMSYRRHRAIDDVLARPGEQDITAHVPFTYLEQAATTVGLSASRLENLAQLLLRAGEPDQFEAALRANDDRASTHLRLQLKTLLFGMGETFRSITLTKQRP